MKTVPTARLCDTEAEKNAKLRRGAKLRQIDKGNCYDITRRMRKLIHEIESGKHGEVTDVVIAVRKIQDGRTAVRKRARWKSFITWPVHSRRKS
jgi:hypothetical protein